MSPDIQVHPMIPCGPQLFLDLQRCIHLFMKTPIIAQPVAQRPLASGGGR